jgi:hypothetical protein
MELINALHPRPPPSLDAFNAKFHNAARGRPHRPSLSADQANCRVNLKIHKFSAERRSTEYLNRFVVSEIEKNSAPIKAAGFSMD